MQTAIVTLQNNPDALNQETEGMMQEAGFENTKYFNLTGRHCCVALRLQSSGRTW